MKHPRKSIATALLLLSGAGGGHAQTDFPLSVLTSSPAQINPANTGLFNDEFRLHSYYKSQVASSLAGGVKGAGVAADYNAIALKMGLGLMVFSNSLDKSALRDFNVLLSYGYRVLLNDWSQLSFGLQGGFKQVGYSIETLTLGSHYDPTYAGGYDPNRPLPQEITNQNNKNSFDASAGLVWQGYPGPYLALSVGMAAFHLIPVQTDFLNDDAHLEPKYVASAAARYEGYYLHWIPSAMLVTQNRTTYAETGLALQLRQVDKFLNLGLYYRTPDVLIPTISLGMDKLSLNLSLEYYLHNTYSQIINIGISYYPQTNRKVSLIKDFNAI